MDSPASLLLVEDPRYLEHEGPRGHPEAPERLAAVARATREFAGETEVLAPREASDEELLRIHTRGHIAGIAAASGRGPGSLDADTYVSPASDRTARLAAGACIDLCARVAQDPRQSGLAAVRPPGHHAEGSHAMGFCLYNNVALATRALQAEHGLDKILIVDWDVHHGNGTQHSFESDPSVLYFSTHQFPFYPGTGANGEQGKAAGLGATVNVPMPAGCGDQEYVAVMRRVLVPVVQRYRPEMILVSCGFDSHREDPLSSMEVSERGFAEMSEIVLQLAYESCGGRCAFLLEGGYSPVGLYEGTRSLLRAISGTRSGALAEGGEPEAGTALRGILKRVRDVHAARYPEIGAL